jgi:hypothetical protein
MITAGELAYADAFFGVPGGVYALDARRLGIAYQNGDPVRYAPDLLGRGVAVQDTLANRPTFNVAGQHLQCDGTQRMALPDSCRLRASQGFVCVFAIDYQSTTFSYLASWTGVAAGTREFEIQQYSQNRLGGYIGNGTFIGSSTGLLSIGVKYIITAVAGSDGVGRLFLNGTQTGSANFGTAANVATRVPFLAGADSSAASYIGGIMGARYYRGYLATEQIRMIERSMARRNGFAI